MREGRATQSVQKRYNQTAFPVEEVEPHRPEKSRGPQTRREGRVTQTSREGRVTQISSKSRATQAM